MRQSSYKQQANSYQHTGKSNRAQNQKELRQAQRQYGSSGAQGGLTLQETDFSYGPTGGHGARTVKNSSAAQRGFSQQDGTPVVSGAQMISPQAQSINMTPAGPSSSASTATLPKNNLQAARAKILSHHGTSQQFKLFGGLSRHVLNASSSVHHQSSGKQSSGAPGHSRQVSAGYLYSKQAAQFAQQANQTQQIVSHRQTSQHNTNYHQTVPTSPQNTSSVYQQSISQQINAQQPCGRTLAALEAMNQSQQKMRKSESQAINTQQLKMSSSQQAIKNLLQHSTNSQQTQQQQQQQQLHAAAYSATGTQQSLQIQKMSHSSNSGSMSAQKSHGNRQSLLQNQNPQQQNSQHFSGSSTTPNSAQKMSSQHFQSAKTAVTQGHRQTLPQKFKTQDEFEENEVEQRSYSALHQMQPSPVPHQQFLQAMTQNQMNDSMYSTQTFANRSSIINQQVSQDKQLLTMLDFHPSQKQQQQSVTNKVNIAKASNMNQSPNLRTGSFAKEESPVPTSAKKTSNPQPSHPQGRHQHTASISAERNTTPELTTPVMNKELAVTDRSPLRRQKTVDVQVGAHLCCHEQAKQHAVLLQKVQFLTEQIKEEKTQAQMKEQQFNKIIAALKQTAEENNAKKKSEPESASKNQITNPNQKDWKETLDELNKNKELVNSLEEKVLELELKAEKVALDHKIALQQKNDELGEERLKLKHKESDLRQSNAQIERLNEDIQNRIQEALDRQSERLGNEKQADIDSMNRRNEQLIKQLVDSHSNETRQLRDLLLQQERKTREAEHNAGNLEIELRAAKLENGNRFDASELEEIQMQNQHVNEIRIQTLQNQYHEEASQLKDVIVQLENHINQLQEQKSEADRKLIIADDKIIEVKKEVAKNKILVASQREKEVKMQQTFKAQIAKERKTADMAVNKMKGVQKLEQELNKKQILINQLRGKILEMEREEMHKSKILLMKRRQIEDEKTVLIKKQALRQRSMTRSNLSATRLQRELETKQAVIQTERESKKALQEEKFKLEKEIASIKREKTQVGGAESSRHNESMSMYFARSQGVFSPRNRADQSTTKSFVAKGNKTSRHQVFMSQQQMDRNQLYLSKQFSNERTSSVGGGSLHGDSMVNIVEFEENASPNSRGRRIENNSILSTPFKHDEPNESKLGQYKVPKNAYSQSVLAQHNTVNSHHAATMPKIDGGGTESHNEDASSHRATPFAGAGVAQFQTHQNVAGDSGLSKELQQQVNAGSGPNVKSKHFSTTQGKKIEQIQDKEEEFIQVLSGCDTSNDSHDVIKNKQILRSIDKQPGGRVMTRKNTKQQQVKGSSQKPERRELQEIKLMKGASVGSSAAVNRTGGKQPHGVGVTRTRTQNSQSFIHKGSASLKDLAGGACTSVLQQKTSPNKLHLNMANMLAEQRMIDSSKQSFVRTVLTARQECQQFNETIRQKDEHALTGRLTTGQKPNEDPHKQEVQQFQDQNSGLQFATSFDAGLLTTQQQTYRQGVQKGASGGGNKGAGPSQHANNIRQLNRNKTQTQFGTAGQTAGRKRSPVLKTQLSYSNDCKEMHEQDPLASQRKSITDNTPEVPNETVNLKKDGSEMTGGPLHNDSFNGLVLQQLVNMTSSIDNGSQREDQSQHSNPLEMENNKLKEQLELIKKSLAAQQEKAANTEMTMMEAIMAMREQIQQVANNQVQQRQAPAGDQSHDQTP